MTTTTSRPSTPVSPSGQPMHDHRIGRERPMGGFELWMWLFMRISGILLVLLAIGHTLIMHVPEGGVSRIDYGFVAERWQYPFWRVWDWMLLSLALIHGINGLRNVTLDYVRAPGARFAINMFFYVIGFAIFVLGTVVVFTFQASSGVS